VEVVALRHQPRPRSALLLIPACIVLAASSASPAGASGDPLWPSQWALNQIGAAQAWSRTTGAGVRIGIVDTGADPNHEDLVGKVVASTSCVGAHGNPDRCSGIGLDDQGHGTQVSAIAAASTNNSKGIAGVAPDARLLVAKALVNDGSGTPVGTVADLNAGIRWVVDRGARVVNLSVGGDWSRLYPGDSALVDGIDYAWSRGAVPVLAAGNVPAGSGGQPPDYGGLDAVVVGASDRSGGVASYSSPLDTAKWGLVAPGGAGGDSSRRDSYTSANVVSAWSNGHTPNGYAVGAGTSMAAAHVSGTLALLMAEGLGQDAAVQQVLGTANASVPCGMGCQGRLDAARASGAAATSKAASAAGPRSASSNAPIFTRTVQVRLSQPSPASPEGTALPVSGDHTALVGEEESGASPRSAPARSLPGLPLSDTGSGLPTPTLVAALAASAVIAGQLMSRRRRPT